MNCSEKFRLREKTKPWAVLCGRANASKEVGVGKGLAACLAWEDLLTGILRLCLSSTQPCLYLEFSTGKCHGKVTLREGFRRCGLEEDQENGLRAALPLLLFQDGFVSGFQRKWKE